VTLLRSNRKSTYRLIFEDKGADSSFENVSRFGSTDFSHVTAGAVAFENLPLQELSKVWAHVTLKFQKITSLKPYGIFSLLLNIKDNSRGVMSKK